jgi:tetratricopeptide (TPR) repeat protein
VRRPRDRSTPRRSSTQAAKTVGERIREARLAAGLTQQQLAGKALTKAFISHLELGRARPSERSIEVIAKRLDKDVAYFLGRDAASRDSLLELHERAAEAASALSDWESQRRHARAALRLSDGRRSVTALRLLAQAEANVGRPDQALALARKGLGLLEDSATDARELALLLLARASAYLSIGPPSAAAEALERAIDALERHRIEDSALRSRLHISLGMAFRRLGDIRQARVEFERALETANKVDALRLAGRAYLGLAAAQADVRDYPSAVRYYERASELLERASDAKNELVAIRCLAETQLESGDVAEARRSAERVVVRGTETGQHEEVAGAKIVLAQVAIHDGRPEEGMRLAREAERTYSARQKDSNLLQCADAIRIIGDAFHAQRRWADSDREYAKALALVEKVSRRSWERIVDFYADRLYQRGKAREAYEWLARARSGSDPSATSSSLPAPKTEALRARSARVARGDRL